MLGKNSKKNSKKISLTVKNLWAAKSKRRVALSCLSIKEKVRILIAMQQAAYPILAKRNKNQLKPWTL